MEHKAVIDGVLFLSGFLAIASALQIISNRWTTIPYTASLILAGFVARTLFELFGLKIPIELSPDTIYFVLLPLLLFESASHVSIHQFSLQFRTINMLATVGLLISVFVVCALLVWLTDLAFYQALLFAAIISSTDPISVISLFKQLGAPRRLALIADAESMLNDATSVIVFKIVVGLVIGGVSFSTNYVATNLFSFLFVFLGSIAYGITLGVMTTLLVNRWRSDLLILNIIALVLALFGFASAEHFFGLSGVIATVSYGIVFGNLVNPGLSHEQEGAFAHFWEFLSFLSVSVVFFFSSFTLDLATVTASIGLWCPVIIAVILGRAVSVYLVCAGSNSLPMFRYEPNIPLSWQHVLVWGGLRGVIPLVLAYSLPLSYADRDLMVALTMTCFLFSLLVNGTTIKPLLVYLGLNRPQMIENLYALQKNIISVRQSRAKLEHFDPSEFDQRVLMKRRADLMAQEQIMLRHLAETSDFNALVRSFKMAANKVERTAMRKLFEKRYMSESVMYAFESQLNQQLDRIEFPDLPHRKTKKEFSFDTSTSWRNRIAAVLGIAPSNRLLFGLFRESRHKIVSQRCSLLQVRLITSHQVIEYLRELKVALEANSLAVRAIELVQGEHATYMHKNRRERLILRRSFPKVLSKQQHDLLDALLDDGDLLNIGSIQNAVKSKEEFGAETASARLVAPVAANC